MMLIGRQPPNCHSGSFQSSLAVSNIATQHGDRECNLPVSFLVDLKVATVNVHLPESKAQENAKGVLILPKAMMRSGVKLVWRLPGCRRPEHQKVIMYLHITPSIAQVLTERMDQRMQVVNFGSVDMQLWAKKDGRKRR